MVILGALANGVEAIIGGLLGLLLKSRVSSRLGDFLMEGQGLVVLMVAIQGMATEGSVLVAVVAMALGGAIGYAIDIDGAVRRFGDWVQERLNSRFAGSGRLGSFSEGFVSATLFICIGAMAVVGSIQSGLTLDHTTLISKGLIDMIVCMVLAATMGVGVPFAGIVVFVYEAALSLLASAVAPFLSDVVITNMVAVGSLLLLAMGLNMLRLTDIKVANFLPAAFLPVAVVPAMLALGVL